MPTAGWPWALLQVRKEIHLLAGGRQGTVINCNAVGPEVPLLRQII